jgi:peptidyl-prolyl cis-trans isomerase A (cyclophilin A)
MCQIRLAPILHAVAVLAVFCSLSGCGKSGPTQSDRASASPNSSGAQTSPANATRHDDASQSVDPIVVLHTTQGDITLKLYPEKAPRTVENFLRGYADRGFYDQTIFHHAERGRMLIAGGYTSELARKPTRAPIYNESHNGLSNRRGTVAMIREADAPHSATSEFFVNLTDNPDFDFKSSEDDDVPGYCVFGEIISGMDVIDRIAQLPTSARGEFPKVPSPAVSIVSVSIVTAQRVQ